MSKVDFCPVCGASHEIDALFCPQCGWEFRIFPDTIPESVIANEEKRIAAYRAEYERTGKQREKIAELNARISSLKEENESLRKKHKDNTEALQNSLKRAEAELINARNECTSAEKKVSDLTMKLSAQLLEFEHLQSDNTRVKKNLRDELEKYKEFVSPEEMESFKASIKQRIDKLYEEIAYQKEEIERLRRGKTK
jgi:chromosome segregation ATPase